MSRCGLSAMRKYVTATVIATLAVFIVGLALRHTGISHQAISEAARCARLDWWAHGACAPVWWWHPLAVYFSPSHAWVGYASKAGINS
jgi:succinate dehydrogenase hydrophobic anchor subunit